MPFYFEWLDHPEDGSYWHFADIEAQHDKVRVPVFNFSGWHDEGYGPIGATRNYAGLRARAATPEARSPRLLIGPWVHGRPTPETRTVGDRNFGEHAGLDYDGLVLDWCDRHAQGIDRAGPGGPPVRLFVMGANMWRDAADWPVPSTPRAYYLRAGGRLTTEAPAAAKRPTPTCSTRPTRSKTRISTPGSARTISARSSRVATSWCIRRRRSSITSRL